jgi:hypothetical protein
MANSFGDAAAAANNPSMAQRATGAISDAFDSARGVSRSMGPIQPVSALRQTGNVLGRVAGPALGIAMEGADVAKVAANPNATGIDVGTQAAQGAGRLATAGLGAMGGAKAGAALGSVLGVPGAMFGGALGGVAGGVAGYFGANKAIEAGRQWSGSDTMAPADRVPAPAATGPMGGVAPTGEQAQVRSVDNALAAPPPTMRRIGNSFDGGSGPQQGDLPAAQRAALGVRNEGVGVVGAAGVTSADRLGQMNRDVAHEQDKRTWRNPEDPTPGAAIINGGFADRNASFNEQANLRNASMKGSWSPR